MCVQTLLIWSCDLEEYLAVGIQLGTCKSILIILVLHFYNKQLKKYDLGILAFSWWMTKARSF